MKRKLFNLSKILLSAVLILGLTAGCNSNNGQKETPDDLELSEGTVADNNTDGNDDTIVLGTNAAFPPFEYTDAGGNIVGFDIEIGKKIAEKLGKTLDIQDVAFESLLVMVDSGKADFIAAGLTITEDRLNSVDFSDTYFEAKQVVLLREGDTSIKTIDDLKDKKIGAQAATTGEILAEELTENSTGFETVTQAAIDLQNEKLDAVIIDYEPAMRVVEANKDSDKKIEAVDVGFESENYAIAVKKGNTELLGKINEVLKELHESGEYDQLKEEFFSNYEKF